jgi:hypothetical protein
MLVVAGWLPVRSVAAACRQASNELRENTTLTKTAADELWSRPGGSGKQKSSGKTPQSATRGRGWRLQASELDLEQLCQLRGVRGAGCGAPR